MGTFTVDLPAFHVDDDAHTIANSDNLSTPDTSSELVLDQFDQPLSVGYFGEGSDESTSTNGVRVNIPTPPDGATLLSASYVVIAYRESSDTTNTFGDYSEYVPTPTSWPFVSLDSSATTGRYTVDGLPVGAYDGETVWGGTEVLSRLTDAVGSQIPANRMWLEFGSQFSPPVTIHVAYFAIRLVYDDGATGDTGEATAPIEGEGPGDPGDTQTFPPGLDPTPPVDGTGPTNPPTGGGFLTPGRRRQSPTNAELVIDGKWATTFSRWGSLKWSHTWPGGSANASWEAADMPKAYTRRGLNVQLMFGGECIWSGVQSDAGNAVGLWAIGVDYAALDSDGEATTVVDDALDAAIARGLQWKRRDSISATAVDLDVSQGPATIGALLDAYAEANTKRWGVDPDGYVYAVEDPDVASAVILPLDQPLVTGGEDFATALIGRYYNGTAYATTDPVTDATAITLNGYKEATVDLTGRGTITETKAVNILKSLLRLGKSKPAWASTISLGYGDILSPGGVPIALERVTAGQMVRVLGLTSETDVLGGQTFVDVVIGQNDVDDGALTLTPFGAPARSLVDLLAQIKKES